MFKAKGVIGRSVSPIFFRNKGAKQEQIDNIKTLQFKLIEKDQTIDLLKEQVLRQK